MLRCSEEGSECQGSRKPHSEDSGSPGAPSHGPALAEPVQHHVLSDQQLQSQALPFISEKPFVRKKPNNKAKQGLHLTLTYTWLYVLKITGPIVLSDMTLLVTGKLPWAVIPPGVIDLVLYTYKPKPYADS